jgi:magnesium-transporting ATPase (P-type)
VPAEELVAGDCVLLEAGDRVPADLRLLRASSLKLDEAMLTGESVAVDKSADPVAADAALGDRFSMAYSGTLVAAGQGLGVVVATGPRTELGRISTMLGTVQTLATPLTRLMDRFARQLTITVLSLSALMFCFALWVRDYDLADAFIAVVGIAVSAIPEGLPVVMTIALAIGVQRMAARYAIVRNLPAVETLGAVSVICSDKTGTLTRNEMSVRAVVLPGASFDIEGEGYAPRAASVWRASRWTLQPTRRCCTSPGAPCATTPTCDRPTTAPGPWKATPWRAPWWHWPAAPAWTWRPCVWTGTAWTKCRSMPSTASWPPCTGLPMPWPWFSSKAHPSRC